MENKKATFTILGIGLGLFFLILLYIGATTPHEHNIKERIVKEATCTEDGTREKYCTKCNYVDPQTIYASHNWTQETVVKQSTCTENGTAIYKCSVCGKTDERTLYADHSLSGNECTKCGAIISNVKPDTWYTVSSNNVVHCQNAEVYDAVSMSKGETFMITYYPICRNCHTGNRMEMTGVGPNTPVTETYHCSNCNEITYSRFKIEY